MSGSSSRVCFVQRGEQIEIRVDKKIDRNEKEEVVREKKRERERLVWTKRAVWLCHREVAVCLFSPADNDYCWLL